MYAMMERHDHLRLHVAVTYSISDRKIREALGGSGEETGHAGPLPKWLILVAIVK